MKSFQDVIDLWPTRAALADDIGVSRVRVSTWRHRDSIPGEFWRRIVKAAKRNGYASVTVDCLARISEGRNKTDEAA